FNFTQDEEILSLLLKRKNAYIGMLASPYKRETIYNHLKEQGISDEALARVHSPIGLPIGAETPEEIALSTAAELVQVRSGYNKR
ncbi:MAG: XdhC family protein, partial [Anaerolineaceae bacterium]|nr:XdhC family protein [Anaerolineaceae bacterium]